MKCVGVLRTRAPRLNLCLGTEKNKIILPYGQHLSASMQMHMCLCNQRTMIFLKLCLVKLLLSNSRDVSLSKSCWVHQVLAVKKLTMKWRKVTIVIGRRIKYHLKTTQCFICSVYFKHIPWELGWFSCRAVVKVFLQQRKDNLLDILFMWRLV